MKHSILNNDDDGSLKSILCVCAVPYEKIFLYIEFSLKFFITVNVKNIQVKKKV